LWQKLQDGHICVPKSELKKERVKHVFPDFDETKVNEDEFISEGTSAKPVIELNGKLYLQRYFNYETIIVNQIKELINNSAEALPYDGSLITEEEVDWQKVATAACLKNNFTIITGGPGTGKTTTVASILKLLLKKNPNYKVALAAPTGKAAARMAESLKERAEKLSEIRDLFQRLEPSTIHRLLGSAKNSTHFKHDENNPLHYDIIIIDESSMIDVALFARLLRAVKKGTKLILLGDKNQLASVEAGSLFGDLCNVPEKLNVFSREFIDSITGKKGDGISLPSTTNPSLLSDHIVELQKSYRFSPEKGIGRLSSIVIHEDWEGLENFLNVKDDVVQIDPDYSEDMFERFVLKFDRYLKEKDISTALKKMNDCRVLCALREGKFGLYEINRRIESILENKRLLEKLLNSMKTVRSLLQKTIMPWVYLMEIQE